MRDQKCNVSYRWNLANPSEQTTVPDIRKKE